MRGGNSSLSQQHADRMARGRQQRLQRTGASDGQLVMFDADQVQRRTVDGMLFDFENSGIDEDLETLRSGWAGSLSAAAQRGKRGAGHAHMFGYMDELDAEQSELNRRGDVAAQRLAMVNGLRQVAKEKSGNSVSSSPCPSSALLSFTGGFNHSRRQRSSLGATDVDYGFGMESTLRGSSSGSRSPASVGGHIRKWRGPLDSDSDDDISECDGRPLWLAPKSSGRETGILALRDDRASRTRKVSAVTVATDDPWDAWEARWASAFQNMEAAANAKRRMKLAEEDEERRRVWEAADQLRQEDVRRQQERKARSQWNDASRKATGDGTSAGSGFQKRGSSTGRTSSSSGHPGFTGASAGSGAQPKSEAPKREAPPRGAQTSQPEGPRFSSFASYEEAWSRFEQKSKDGQPISYADIPWPTSLSAVSGAAGTDEAGARKSKLRAALLRWHPDKWAPLLSRIRETDQASVTEKVKEVTRRILEEKQRFGG